MTRRKAIQDIIKIQSSTQNCGAKAYACSNIALIKYWGKRDITLNLPVTDSLSIGLNNYGATTIINPSKKQEHTWQLNNNNIAKNHAAYKRLCAFLDDIRPDAQTFYDISSNMNIPMAAGLASSACGFASLVKALNQYHAWQLPASKLSALARIGSGSACRSICNGFVHWHRGIDKNGYDSIGEALKLTWPELRIGLLCLETKPKPISSTKAMLQTQSTSDLYSAWPEQVKKSLPCLLQSIKEHDFKRFGEIAEHNALSMHALMLSARPAIIYSTSKTWENINKIHKLRSQGLAIYFTQDAGPNLKCLFLCKDQQDVTDNFPNMQVIKVFDD